MASKKYIYFLLSFIFLIAPSAHANASAVTYDFSGGRFGDCLLSYCHAKWISYKYNIPLLYKPFNYSDQLAMHEKELFYDARAGEYQHIITLSKENMKIVPNAGILYVVPFFPESIFNRYDREFPYLFATDWHDSGFKMQLQKMIRPIVPLKKFFIPEGMLSIAVHIRKGTGWDIPVYKITPAQLTASHPLRFAPDSFYIAQLKRLATIFPDQMIYVYLFTDHNNPAELADKFYAEVNCDRMIIDYRKTENNEFVNVLDDFFALTKFDCLIRPDSNFSYIASKIAQHTIVLCPWHGTVQADATTIGEINFEINEISFVIKESF